MAPGGENERPNVSCTYAQRRASGSQARTAAKEGGLLDGKRGGPVTAENFEEKMRQAMAPALVAAATPPVEEARDIFERLEGADGLSAEEAAERLRGDHSKRHCIKNVHELLESGTNKRLYDDLDYLVAGIEDSASCSLPAGRASSASLLSAGARALMADLGSKLFGETAPMHLCRIRSLGIIERLTEALGALARSDDDCLVFLTLLLLVFCPAVTRIDHFVALDVGACIIERLLEMGTASLVPPVGDLQCTTASRDAGHALLTRKVYALSTLPQMACEEAAAWLTAKMCNALATVSGSNTEHLQAFSAHLSEGSKTRETGIIGLFCDILARPSPAPSRVSVALALPPSRGPSAKYMRRHTFNRRHAVF